MKSKSLDVKYSARRHARDRRPAPTASARPMATTVGPAEPNPNTSQPRGAAPGTRRTAEPRSATPRSSRAAARSRAPASTVGATSARTPPDARSVSPGTVTISGTGFSECAVFGLPSSSSMWSALPWSAVMMHAPPDSWTASTTAPKHAIDGLDRRHRGLDHAGVPDHVGVGEVDDPERRRVLAPGAERTRRRPRGRSSRASCRTSGRPAARGPARGVRRRTRLLLAAVEEVRDVGVLLGLGDVQLAHPALGETLGAGSSPGASGANATG